MAQTNLLQMAYKTKSGGHGKYRLDVVSTLVDPENAIVKGAGSLRTLVEAMSAVSHTRASIAIPTTLSPTTVIGPFHAVDKATLQFSDAVSRTHKIGVPTPKVTCFLADSAIVDDAQQDVAAFVDLILASCSGADGQAMNYYNGGRRTGTHHRSRN